MKAHSKILTEEAQPDKGKRLQTINILSRLKLKISNFRIKSCQLTKYQCTLLFPSIS